MPENTDQIKSKYGHFSPSDTCCWSLESLECIFVLSECTQVISTSLPYLTSNLVKQKERRTRPEVLLTKGVLKICSKFTGEHPCRSAILIKLLCNFIESALRHGCSPVNLLHTSRTPFPSSNGVRTVPRLTFPRQTLSRRTLSLRTNPRRKFPRTDTSRTDTPPTDTSRTDTSSTDISPTRHFPDDDFPDGHFPDDHFPDGHFPDQTHPWRSLPRPDKFFLFLIRLQHIS